MENSNDVESQSGCLDYFKMKLTTLDKICCFLGELIGTALLVFLGCMGCVNTSPWLASHLQMTLNFGLVVMVIVQSFGCVSGAHLNPAVTLAAYIYNLVSLSMAAVYVVAQLLGGFIGYGLLKMLLPAYAITQVNPKYETTMEIMQNATEKKYALCVTVPHPDISAMQGFGIEFIITAVLAMVCCGVWDPRNSRFHDSVAIRFGLAISCLACTAGPFTGASMNPARSFAPALWNMEFDHHWIYWAAPLLAAGITTLAYKAVFRREVQEEKPNSKLRAMEEVPLS